MVGVIVCFRVFRVRCNGLCSFFVCVVGCILCGLGSSKGLLKIVCSLVRCMFIEGWEKFRCFVVCVILCLVSSMLRVISRFRFSCWRLIIYIFGILDIYFNYIW